MTKMYKFDPNKKINEDVERLEITEEEVMKYLEDTDLVIEMLLYMAETDQLTMDNLEFLENDPILLIQALLAYIVLKDTL